MSETFKVDSNQFTVLEKYIQDIGLDAENIINEYLHTKASNDAISSIKQRINIGKNKHSRKQPQAHAKYGDSLKIMKFNLGFEVKNKKGYGYLFFPDSGQGRSQRITQNIFKTGLEEQMEKIENELLIQLQKRIGGQ